MNYSQSPPLAEAFDLDALDARRVGRRPVKPSIPSPRSSNHRDEQAIGDRPRAGRRAIRTFMRFVIAILIGVGVTLAWQSYGDEARKMLAAEAPALSWLLSGPTKKSATVATPPGSTQRLDPWASSLDAVRRSVEQLAARQDQMAQDIATLQAAEEDIRQRASSTPPSPSPQTAPAAPPRPAPPRIQSSAPSSPAPRAPAPAGPLVLSR